MKCIECGHELKDGAIFCIRCGAMQVSMDGKPIERNQEWPDVDAANGSNWRSSTDGALYSAQSRTPRSFQAAPKRNGGRIAAIVVGAVAVIAIGTFAAVSFFTPATSGDGSSASQAAVTTDSSSSASASSSSASSSSASSSASSASASASSASASSSAVDVARGTTNGSTSGSTSQDSTAQAQTQTQAQSQPQQEAAPAQSTAYNDYYVLPSSSSYYYSEGELTGMSTYDLYIARNEIFARHGRMFNRSDLQDYFNSQAWYQPLYTPSQWDSMGNQLNDYELKNAALIKKVEEGKGSPYL